MGSSNKASQDKTIGSTAGSVIGGAIGSVIFPGVGTVIGSVAGSELGGAIGNAVGGGSGSSSGLGGLLGSSSSTSNSTDISGLQEIATGQVSLGNQDAAIAGNVINAGSNILGQGGQIYSPAYSQYVSGLTGQLTPAQQAMVTENLGAMNAGTSGTYGNLGLGGSTMESQDLTSNALKSMAEQANLDFGNEQMGLSGLSTANQYYNTADQFYNTGSSYMSDASNAYSGASGALTGAGELSSKNLSSLNSAISSLSGKSSGSSGSGSSGGLLSGLSSLFGSSAGSGTGVGTGSALSSSGVDLTEALSLAG